MKKLSAVAERTGCAVVLIGHMNKASGMKSGYRGLGSIDFTAAARSILVVGRIQDEPTVRVIAQSKNSLAPEGKSIAFELDPEHGFQWKWKGACEITVDELLSGGGQVQTKTMQMEDELKRILNAGEISAEKILLRADELGTSERTHENCKEESQHRLRKTRRPMVLEASQGCKSVTFLSLCTLAFFPRLSAHEALCALLRKQVWRRYPGRRTRGVWGRFAAFSSGCARSKMAL